MASKTAYLKQRGMTWWFCMSVPKALKGQYGKHHVEHSLGTRDADQAAILVLPYIERYRREFAARMGKATPALNRETYLDFLDLARAEVRVAERPEDASRDMIYRVGRGTPLPPGALGLGIGPRPRVNWTPSDNTLAKLAAITDAVTEEAEGAFKPRREYMEPFSGTTARFLVEQKRKGNTAQSIAQDGAVLRLFGDHVKDRPLSRIHRVDVAGFLDIVRSLSPAWGRSPKTKERSLKEIQALFGGVGGGIGQKTINRYVSTFTTLWKWAKTRGEVSGDSPFEGFNSAAPDNHYRPFSVDELRSLFTPAPKNIHLLEIPLVGLFSGMRLNEICTLRWTDLKETEGVWWIDVQDAKTRAGERKVPVHPHLGWLVTRRKTAKDLTALVWPKLTPGGPDKKPGHYLSGDFSTHVRQRLGADLRTRLSFHSLRKNVVQCLEGARVPYNEMALVIGHERQFTTRVYNPDGLAPVHLLRHVVEKIDYPGLDLPAIAAGPS